MVRDLLKHQGVALVDTAFVLAALAVLIFMVLRLANGAITHAKAVQTIHNLSAIAEAACQYYKRNSSSNSSWPQNLSDLQPDFISSQVTANPFGFGYQLQPQSRQITVSSLVPAGTIQLGQMGAQMNIISQGALDRIVVSRPTPLGIQAWLAYDKKNTYNQ